MVSIHWPCGYEPHALPLRHFAIQPAFLFLIWKNLLLADFILHSTSHHFTPLHITPHLFVLSDKDGAPRDTAARASRRLCSVMELNHPLRLIRSETWTTWRSRLQAFSFPPYRWTGWGSNPRVRCTADLKSAPLDHSGTCPVVNRPTMLNVRLELTTSRS